MSILIVVNNVREWPFQIPGVEVVDASSYLTRPEYGTMRAVKLFNLCRSYRYQTAGYYVTLLATARAHKPLPSITTIQDMKSQTMVRFVSDDLDDLIQIPDVPHRDDVSALFDELDEMGMSGPSVDEFRKEFAAVHLEGSDTVILDVRQAGQLTHRTLAIVVALVRQILSGTKRCAVLGHDEFLDVWKVTRLDSLCAAFADVAQAAAYLQRN